MPELIIIVIVAAVAAAFGSLYLRLRRLNAAAERALMEARRALDDARRSREQAVLEKENIVGEERRMFQFLEHMGTALAVNSQDPAALYEMIATGTAKVVDAPESCLYIRDRRTSMLVPVYLSPRCPPLIALPEHLRGGGDEAGIGSYLRLASVPMDYGIFGRTFLDGQDGGVQQVPNVALDRAAQDWPAAQPHRGVGALVAPLYYQDRKLGILAVCRPPGARPFSENDIDVFGSVAQQSGFTLGNAVLFQDA
ncbi:MAG: GAF domain-containing protein, partial [Verrucomicrobiales bacterium]